MNTEKIHPIKHLFFFFLYSHLPHKHIRVGRVPERQHGRALLPTDLGLEQGGDVGPERVGVGAHLAPVNHLLGRLFFHTVARLHKARVEVHVPIAEKGQGHDQAVAVDRVRQQGRADSVISRAYLRVVCKEREKDVLVMGVKYREKDGSESENAY